MIELKDVSRVYRHGEASIRVLNSVHLHIEQGEWVALVGPSGAGKSTLLYLMGLMDLPSGGEIFFGGRPTAQLSDAERSKLRGSAIGFVFQSFHLLPQLRAWQNVALPLRYAGIARSEHRKRALPLLEQMGLLEQAEQYPSELSGGQEQRVAIARALVMSPRVLFADEPTGNLDSVTGQRILLELEAIHRMGTTVVMVTHSSEVAAQAERIVQVQDGRVIASDTDKAQNITASKKA